MIRKLACVGTTLALSLVIVQGADKQAVDLFVSKVYARQGAGPRVHVKVLSLERNQHGAAEVA